MNEYLSLLCFPQNWENGILKFNIVILPRNFSPLRPWEIGMPAFADANIVFSAKLVPSLDGLPLLSSPTTDFVPELTDPPTQPRIVWEAFQKQFETAQKMQVVDADASIRGNGFAPHPSTLMPLRKHLPLSYRNAFNFIKPRTKNAVIGDEYACSIKNNADNKDVSTNRNSISWGKLVAFSLRNPLLAKKLGLIYEASIDLNPHKDILNNGGYLYVDLDTQSDFFDTGKRIYAARIPSLKDKQTSTLFSVNQFRVTDDVANSNSAGYDEIIRESIAYDDGFAKIVHASQPINQDHTKEDDFSNPPLNDVGIRLGWEDEQITIWYNRQMLHVEETTGTPVDCQMGVFGYHIDAREFGQSEWLSQNSIINTSAISLADNTIEIVPANTISEPGTEVTPSSHGDVATQGLWAPMYYTSWIGRSLAVADSDAADIYLLKNDTVVPFKPKNETANLVPKKTFSTNIQEPSQHLPLRYGRHYEFQVRLMDISGGGPKNSDVPKKGGENPIAKHHFKRYIGAGAIHIEQVNEFYENEKLRANGSTLKDASLLENLLNDGSVLSIRRPLLSYPAVVFTGKYKDPIALMKEQTMSHVDTINRKAIEVGLPDPDVDQFQIKVEAKSLEMDNASSEKGKESYIKLYEKIFTMPINSLFDQAYDVKIIFRDFKDINLTETLDGLPDLADDELILPTARKLRITITSIISVADPDSNMYLEGYADKAIFHGKSVQLTAFKPSLVEENLLSFESDNVQAFYLQPENSITQNLEKVFEDGNIAIKIQESQTPAELIRLADRLDLVANQLTLQGEKGKRVQFACSREIRHSLAPDSSSLTLSSLDELFNHWIVALDFNIERDWAWTGLKPESFSVYRSWNVPETGNKQSREKVGTIQISNTANINSLYNPDRKKTRVVFFDVMDPKKTFEKFPREFNVKYEIEVHFKEGFSSEITNYPLSEIALPVTIIPSQIPKLISAGLALTPYVWDKEKYRFTEQRAKYLWLEFDEKLWDPNTIYQVRVLATSADPLLSKITQEKMELDLQDEPMQLDEEKIRHIIPGMTNDSAGVKAMQPMIPEMLEQSNSAKIFMVPLPKNLHPNSDELFGFFTYEIRVGYKADIWSTAQARFGRPLRANGVQHPAPNLFCTASIKDLLSYKEGHLIRFEHRLLNEMMVNDIMTATYKNQELLKFKKEEVAELAQDFEKLTTLEQKKKLWRKKLPNILPLKSKKIILVKAPYAMAVEGGKNVTASPPQTSLWYLLYTQVKQADGKSYRNVLIDSGMLNCALEESEMQESLTPSDQRTYGTARIALSNIQDRLQLIGLPRDNDLSVLVAEMFPMHNTWSFEFNEKIFTENIERLREMLIAYYENRNSNINLKEGDWSNPLIEELGKYRIYRTSPLVPIELGCCDEC